MRIYLDNNATTAVHPEVLRMLERAVREVFGNASSIHKEGQTARQMIESARESVAALVGAETREIVFTSGGTESNNAAIFGALGRGERSHIVTSGVEHPSVIEAVHALGRRGHDVTVVPPLRSGVVPHEAMVEAMRPDTRLVTMMLANNETGVVQQVSEVGRAARERGIHFHCDAVQAGGKIAIDVSALQCDTLAVSAHKMHAPKGIGALYVRKGVSMESQLLGGAQERRRRAGTENVPLAAAFGVAAQLARTPMTSELRDRFEAALPSDAVVNGRDVPRLPNTSNVTFPAVDGEGLVIALDLAGVAVSTGSACSSGRVEPSPVLLAMGLTPDQARSTVRFSLGRFTTAEEVDRAVAILREVLPRCRR